MSNIFSIILFIYFCRLNKNLLIFFPYHMGKGWGTLCYIHQPASARANYPIWPAQARGWDSSPVPMPQGHLSCSAQTRNEAHSPEHISRHQVMPAFPCQCHWGQFSSVDPTRGRASSPAPCHSAWFSHSHSTRGSNPVLPWQGAESALQQSCCRG